MIAVEGPLRRQVLSRLFRVDGKPLEGLESAPPLSSAEVAALFRASERAIRLWAAKGELPHIRSLGGGRIKYPAREIAAVYINRYGFPSNELSVDDGAVEVNSGGHGESV